MKRSVTLPLPEKKESKQILSNQELTSKVAVVTGASQGIGRAIALELARAGACVFVHAGTNAQKAAATANEILEMGLEATSHVADIANSDVCEDLVHRAYQWRGDVDIWVNNAGADVLTGKARDLDWETKLQRLWQVDVAGAIRLSREVGKRMRERVQSSSSLKKDYCILNMGWDQAHFGMGGDSGELFSTIKGAVMAFTKSLAISLAPHVRVNCLAPGWIKTSWGEIAPDYWAKRAIGESLLARWGDPVDVAQVARFLCSPAAAFVNGQIIPINGGFRHGR